MGSAIECFDDAGAVVVPRSRFAPVKTCNDLFVLRSGAWGALQRCVWPAAAVLAPALACRSHCRRLPPLAVTLFLLSTTHTPTPTPTRTTADAYKVTEESTVVLAAANPPLIKLDDKHYK